MSQARGASASFLIFPVGPADAEALARVHVAAWRETYRGLLPDAYLARMSEAANARRFARALARPGPDDVLLAAGGRGGLVGYAAGGPARGDAPGEAEIATLYLLQAVQGQGLGAGLLRQAARALAARGARSLTLSVLRDNLRARGFYAHMGGIAGAPHAGPGPGGGQVEELVYRWPDIRTLAG